MCCSDSQFYDEVICLDPFKEFVDEYPQVDCQVLDINAHVPTIIRHQTNT